MQNWVHAGFSVFQGEAIAADDHQAGRRLAGYMVHPPISLERLRYRPDTAQVIYYGRQRGACGDASPARIFAALDFLAGLCTHIPDSGQQLIRYYGAFSNARRISACAAASACAAPAGVGVTQKDGPDSGEEFARGRRRSWARLIKKVYEADPPYRYSDCFLAVLRKERERAFPFFFDGLFSYWHASSDAMNSSNPFV
jgi:hypothetical protein